MSNNKNTLIFEKNFNLHEYLFEILRRWHITAIIVSVSLILSLVYSFFIATPMYHSTAKLYVINKATDNISSSDFSISTYLTNDFSEIITDKFVLDKVAEDLQNKYSSSQLKNCITLEVPLATRIIEITARTTNAADSKMIVDSICKISQENLSELMGLDRITIISEGNRPSAPSTPNVEQNLSYTFIFSLVLSLFLVFIIYITNTKISSSEDVEKYLDISVLSTVPYNHNKLNSKN